MVGIGFGAQQDAGQGVGKLLFGLDLFQKVFFLEVQLAKGAIAAGARILLKRLGAQPGDVRRLYLAGAFGNYINRESARRIGLIEFPPETVEPAGNTALLGAKMALFAEARVEVEHISLASDPEFQDTFAESMLFD